MKLQQVGRISLAACAALVLAGAAAAQDMPKPGPEHKLFEADAGSWDATVEMFMPGAPPMTSKGSETNTIGCGGLCLISDFKSEIAGAPFTATARRPGIPRRRSTWAPGPTPCPPASPFSEMTYDAATQTATGWQEGPDMTGKVVKSKGVVQYKDANNRVLHHVRDRPGRKRSPVDEDQLHEEELTPPLLRPPRGTSAPLRWYPDASDLLQPPRRDARVVESA